MSPGVHLHTCCGPLTAFVQHKPGTVLVTGGHWSFFHLPNTHVGNPATHPWPTQLLQGHPAKSSEDRCTLHWLICPAAPHRACPPSPHPGHLSDCSRAPPAKDPAKAGVGPAAASDPCGKAVQTQQPCSVRASLSADICSGLASDGGGARGPGDSQLAVSEHVLAT